MWLALLFRSRCCPISESISWGRGREDQRTAGGGRGCVPSWIHAVKKIGYKIREAQLQKVPYMLVVGDQEVEEGTDFRPRRRKSGDAGSMALGDLCGAGAGRSAR